eukprot:15358768-Ditylum_brightwellii.AAC.1
MLAGIKYTKQHSKVCQYLHWCILQDYNISVNPNWQKHKPKPATLISNQLPVTDTTVPMDINMIKAAT